MTTETILTDAEIITIGHQARGIEPGENGYILPVTFARAIEQAVLAKLAEQEPVAYAAFSNNGNIRLWSTLPQIGGGEVDLYPLYAHPMPNCQGFLDSSITPLAQRKIQSKIVEGYRKIENATVLVNEHGRAAIVNHGGAFYWVENNALVREYDGRPIPIDSCMPKRQAKKEQANEF